MSLTVLMNNDTRSGVKVTKNGKFSGTKRTVDATAFEKGDRFIITSSKSTSEEDKKLREVRVNKFKGTNGDTITSEFIYVKLLDSNNQPNGDGRRLYPGFFSRSCRMYNEDNTPIEGADGRAASNGTAVEAYSAFDGDTDESFDHIADKPIIVKDIKYVRTHVRGTTDLTDMAIPTLDFIEEEIVEGSPAKGKGGKGGGKK